jgi:regulator of sigma D
MRRGRRNIADVWIRLGQERKQELQQYFQKLRGISTNGEKLSRLDRLRLRRFIEEYAFWDTGGSDAHVYRLASHMNHACRSCANAQQYTEMASPNAITVALVRTVRANEEILINYNRRSSLKCSVCEPSETRELLNALSEGMSRLSCSLLIDQALRRDVADDFPSVAPGSIV